MSFTDADLARTKEWANAARLTNLQAMVARLEAAESVCGFLTPYLGNESQEKRSLDFMASLTTWRKSKGETE